MLQVKKMAKSFPNFQNAVKPKNHLLHNLYQCSLTEISLKTLLNNLLISDIQRRNFWINKKVVINLLGYSMLKTSNAASNNANAYKNSFVSATTTSSTATE